MIIGIKCCRIKPDQDSRVRTEDSCVRMGSTETQHQKTAPKWVLRETNVLYLSSRAAGVALGVKIAGLTHMPSASHGKCPCCRRGWLLKHLWTNSNSVIRSHVNSPCSFTWIRYFLLLIQNPCAVLLCPTVVFLSQ